VWRAAGLHVETGFVGRILLRLREGEEEEEEEERESEREVLLTNKK
jgi:hypothetical protein